MTSSLYATILSDRLFIFLIIWSWIFVIACANTRPSFVLNLISKIEICFYLVLTLIGESWKTHPEIFPKFQFFGAWHSPVGLAYAPILCKTLNRHSQKMMDEFSRNRSSSCPGKLKFRKNFWMSLPGFANKGWGCLRKFQNEKYALGLLLNIT